MRAQVRGVGLGVVIFAALLLSTATAQSVSQPKSSATHAASTTNNIATDPKKSFEAGEAALRAGNLDEAERNFRQVVALQPGVAGAYANLGVIHMRRKQWPQALTMLHKAEKLAPGMVGVRLNIGLVYFR